MEDPNSQIQRLSPLPQLLELNPNSLDIIESIKLENGNNADQTNNSSSKSVEDFKEIQHFATKTNVLQSNSEPLATKSEASQKLKSKPRKKGKTGDFVSSILDQDHDNVIDFFENIDPMLAWALLKSKILPQVGSFDLLAEKAKLKIQNWEPATVVKILLDELDTLIGDVIKMLQSCCETTNFQDTNAIQLNQSLSLQLFGANATDLLTVKSLEEFPLMYKEKLFKPQEMKPLQLVKIELGDVDNLNNEDEDVDESDKVLQELGLNDEDFIDNGEVAENEEEDDENSHENDPDFKIEDHKNDTNGEDIIIKKKSNANNVNSSSNNANSKNSSKKSPQTCEKCHKTYNTQTQFRIHQRDAWRCPGKPEPKWLRIVKGKDYYCLHPDCSADGVNGPLFPRRNKYWVHLREKHWNREIFAFDCSYCQDKFPFYDMLRQHIKQYHEKAHVCKYCGSSFSRRRDLTLHERRHTGEKPYSCEKCEFRCNTAGSLRMHTVRRHEDPNLHRTHVCEICGKSFHAAYILKEHILTHSDIKRYTCDICGRQLRNDSCYRRHMMNIHGQKITCDQCNKDFSSPMGVKIHKRDAHGILY